MLFKSLAIKQLLPVSLWMFELDHIKISVLLNGFRCKCGEWSFLDVIQSLQSMYLESDIASFGVRLNEERREGGREGGRKET